ncbi:uncharacterized protein [Dysidea avara]|uniref:uncharacterized protein isoform X2 n=1 Tax=Dysidea avara TaxID=196820 RepID=UPI00332957D2
MATDNLPPSVLRPKDTNPMIPSVASVHLRHSYVNPRRTTGGARSISYSESRTQPKEPLPPGPQSVYMRTASDTRLLTNIREISTGDSSIASDDVPLSSINEEQYSGSCRASVTSTVSDDFYWPNDVIFEDDDHSKSLERCQQSILKPYFLILKLIGWRPLFPYNDIHDSYIRKLLNHVFAVVFPLIFLSGFIFQEILCFFRARAYQEEVHTNGSSFIYVRCDGGYLRQKGEHLSNLTEKVFLGYTDKTGQFSQKKLIQHLKILGIIGIVWLILSVPLNILRVASLKLLHKDTYFYYISDYHKEELIDLYSLNMPPQPEFLRSRYVYIALSIVSFTISDLFYIAAIINYALQCQLITFLVNVTVARIRNNCLKVDRVIKEIKVTQDFLKVLNGQVASQMSLLLYVLIQTSIFSVRSWLSTDGDELLAVIIGLLNVLSWLFLALFIVTQATRLTVACHKIRNLGMELRSRPFAYAETSQLDLDSLLLYTTSIVVDAHLVHIPMKPLFVLPVLFAIATISSIATSPF